MPVYILICQITNHKLPTKVKVPFKTVKKLPHEAQRIHWPCSSIKVTSPPGGGKLSVLTSLFSLSE